MSCLDYDTQKWIMVSFASVAITLIIGLVLMQYAHGQENDTGFKPTNPHVNFSFPNAHVNFSFLKHLNASDVHVEGSFPLNMSGIRYTCYSTDGTFAHIQCVPNMNIPSSNLSVTYQLH